MKGAVFYNLHGWLTAVSGGGFQEWLYYGDAPSGATACYNGNRIQYVYSPEGQKLRATWQTAVANIVVPLNTTANLTSSQVSSTTRTDYIGNVVYTGTSSSSSASVSLSKYLFEGGYATVTPTTQPVFHYYTQDHLGNNRAVVNQSGTVEQITHYYPFGGFFADAGIGSSLQPYKYNGKELDRMHGLDLYDYGARQYDPVVPMFTQQDPVAEKYYHLSPYVYCGNNPVNAIDPEKGYTHGCIEVEHSFFDLLFIYRMKNKTIGVKVQYPHSHHVTNGGTRK